MKLIETYSPFVGRVLISILFLMAGISKLGAGYAGTQAYMNSVGVPGSLLPLVIATELVGAVAIILGFKTRLVAFLLAGFTVLAAIFFHSNLSDQIQSIMFMKNIAIAGGFLFLVANGAGPLSIDNAVQKK